MAFEDTSNPLDQVFGLLTRKLELDAEAKAQQSRLQGMGGDALYGVDEYGRAYLRGNASTAAPLTSALGGVPPLIALGVGVLAVTLIVYVLKN